MSEKEWAGFILGCAIGFDLDSEQVENILQAAQLGRNTSLPVAQNAIRLHVGEARWESGIRLIQARMRPADLN